MKSILRFIGNRRAILLWGVLCTAVFTAVFALYGIDLRVIWYPLVLCAAVTAGFFLRELQKEEPELFSEETVAELREMLMEGVRQEIAWGHYVIGDEIPGLTRAMVADYIRYLGNLRWTSLGYEALYPENLREPEEMRWVSEYSNANLVKTDFFEARSTAYAKSTALLDDL